MDTTSFAYMGTIVGLGLVLILLWGVAKLISQIGSVPSASQSRLVKENNKEGVQSYEFEGSHFQIQFNAVGAGRLIKHLQEEAVINVWRNRNDPPQVKVYISGAPIDFDGDNCISVLRNPEIFSYLHYRSPQGFFHYYSIFDISRRGAKIKRIEKEIPNFRTPDEKRSDLIAVLYKKPKLRVLKAKFSAELNFKIAPNKDNIHLELRYSEGASLEAFIHKYCDVCEANEKLRDFQWENSIGYGDDDYELGESENILYDFNLFYKGQQCNVSPLMLEGGDVKRFVKLWAHYKPKEIIVRDRMINDFNGKILVHFELTFSS